VYNTANIARVKADEEAAAAREAADEQRMQELDAERRAAILRGRTPPPLPTEADQKTDSGRKRDRDDRGHDKKRRKLAGEDDTDMDIRLAASITAPAADKDEDARILKLRNTKLEAPLTDHAGNIDLFPVDMKEAIKREKDAEVEREKRKKERAFEDQYTMRFSNAAGREGLERPWYAAQQQTTKEAGADAAALEYVGFENKNVWGNEDPRRKERAQARIMSSDPLAFMQQAQTQLKKSKEDRKSWAAERDRELRELRVAQEHKDRRSRHHKRQRKDDDGVDNVFPPNEERRGVDKARSSRHRHRHRQESRSRDDSAARSSHRHERRRTRSRSNNRERESRSRHSSSRRGRDEERGRH
jgi:hypothetical protein